MDRREFLAYLGAFSLISPRPVGAVEPVTTTLAVMSIASGVMGLFGSKGDTVAQMVAANHKLLVAIQRQVSDIQLELENISRDLAAIMRTLDLLDERVEFKRRKSDLMVESVSILRKRAEIAEHQERYGSEASIDAFLLDLADRWKSLEDIRAYFLNQGDSADKSVMLHLMTVMTLDLSTIGFLATVDISRIKNESVLTFIDRDWSISLLQSINEYEQYCMAFVNEEGNGILQSALTEATEYRKKVSLSPDIEALEGEVSFCFRSRFETSVNWFHTGNPPPDDIAPGWSVQDVYREVRYSAALFEDITSAATSEFYLPRFDVRDQDVTELVLRERFEHTDWIDYAAEPDLKSCPLDFVTQSPASHREQLAARFEHYEPARVEELALLNLVNLTLRAQELLKSMKNQFDGIK